MTRAKIRRSLISPAAFALLTLAATPPAVAAPKSTVELWVRGTGDDARRKVATVDIDSLKLEEKRHADVEYEGAPLLRGVPLAQIIARYAPPPETDLALLHFSGGMIVPLPFRDGKAMARLDPFLARAIRVNSDDPWKVGEFPPIERKIDSVDARKIEFTAGNHLAVADRWHPDVPEKHKDVFSPWTHVDSLAGIEFVVKAAWYRQFAVDPSVQGGAEMFQRSCQFCHGARKIGARFGWDFVEPMPITTHRKSGRSLFFHVRYRDTSQATVSRVMPALTFMTEEDARALWLWLKAIGEKPMPPYRP